MAQLRPAARRQAQRQRLLAVLEVVHIAPIIGRRLRLGLLFQHLLHHGVLADAGRTEGVKVVAIPLHANTELHRL